LAHVPTGATYLALNQNGRQTPQLFVVEAERRVRIFSSGNFFPHFVETFRHVLVEIGVGCSGVNNNSFSTIDFVNIQGNSVYPLVSGK